jgi:hypothetical protein
VAWIAANTSPAAVNITARIEIPKAARLIRVSTPEPSGPCLMEGPYSPTQRRYETGGVRTTGSWRLSVGGPPSDTYLTRGENDDSPCPAYPQVRGCFVLVDVKGLEPMASRV